MLPYAANGAGGPRRAQDGIFVEPGVAGPVALREQEVAAAGLGPEGLRQGSEAKCVVRGIRQIDLHGGAGQGGVIVAIDEKKHRTVGASGKVPCAQMRYFDAFLHFKSIPDRPPEAFVASLVGLEVQDEGLALVEGRRIGRVVGGVGAVHLCLERIATSRCKRLIVRAQAWNRLRATSCLPVPPGVVPSRQAG